jgi:hypothetical protein
VCPQGGSGHIPRLLHAKQESKWVKEEMACLKPAGGHHQPNGLPFTQLDHRQPISLSGQKYSNPRKASPSREILRSYLARSNTLMCIQRGKGQMK